MKKQSFLVGTLILSLSGILCKILGSIYKIPLANILGSQGMGYYYIIFPIYAFILTFVSSNFTISISRCISQAVADDNNELVTSIFTSSIYLLMIIGGIFSVLIAVLSKIIASLQGLENAFICYLIIAPTIFAVALQSVFKGFFQGLKNMTPSALSQILNQVIKMVVGFSLASLLSNRGVLFSTTGVFVGLSIAELLTTIYFLVYYLVFKVKNKSFFYFERQNEYKTSQVMKLIFKEAIPFTLSAVIFPMSLVIDSFLIVNILKSMGFEKAFATELLGLNSGIVNTLINLPSTLSVSICVTIVPFITYSLSRNDLSGIASKTALAFKITILIALPCLFAFAFFSKDIISLLFSHTLKTRYEINVASSLLTLSSINVLYLSILQLTTALLQALNRAYIPVISLSISLIFKVICELILIYNPYFNISGAVVSNSVCFFISSAINVFYLRRTITFSCSLTKTIICPFLSTLGMIVVVFVFKNLFCLFLNKSFSIVFSFLLGGIVYFVFIFLLKTFTKEEQKSFFMLRTKKVEKS